MKVYAKYFTENGINYRTNTLLQFGDSWEIIGSIVCINPGSAKPMDSIVLSDEIFNEIEKISGKQNKADWKRFSPDSTMGWIKRVFNGYYGNMQQEKDLSGVIQLFNLFNLRDQQLDIALKSINQNESSFLFSTESDIKLMKDKPVFIGCGKIAHVHPILNKKAKEIFDSVTENTVYSKEFHQCDFFHPRYINMSYKHTNVQQILQQFYQKLIRNMSKRESIARYTLIINKLRRSPATFPEIADYLDQESDLEGYNYRISKRTFDRDREDIESLYNIEIKYNFSMRKYSIDYESEPEANERILEAFDTFNALNITDRLSNYIYFEKRKPQGTEHLYGLLHAIKNNKQVKFEYHKYWEDIITNRTVEPYALKEFKQRWYLLCNDLKNNKIRTFALDRMKELEISKKSFTRPLDFDLNQYFKNSFGIISSEGHQVEEVILSFNPIQGKYIKSLPLHETQQVLIDNEKETRISLQIYPTFDFVQELLSQGDNVQVLAPDSLINEVKEHYKQALKQYK